MAAKSSFNYVVEVASGGAMNLQSDSASFFAMSVSDGASTVTLKFSAVEMANLSRLLLMLNESTKIDKAFNPG